VPCTSTSSLSRFVPAVAQAILRRILVPRLFGGNHIEHAASSTTVLLEIGCVLAIMARVPFVGRLFWREYFALFGSLILVALEGFIRIITLGLPQPIIRLGYNASRTVFNRLSSQKSKKARSKRKSLSHSIAICSDFTELCALYGYYAEEHVVQTGDGYLLGVHRLPYRKGEDQSGSRVNAGPGTIGKPVVYLHHGLLMNSEVWVCLTEEERCLPFALAQQGYDVWLGNNRGNKYSKKSTQFSPTSDQFWNFSMDQFAFHDIPDTIDYILDTTSRPSLSYIGFSQGTAQAFATLSIHPGLNEKINLFIALAPAMSPAGLSNGIVDALVKTSPDILFLAFGRKSILSSATMWQSILYPPIFVRLIDMSLSFLFAWYGRNISMHQKLAAYPHLYSFTSTKSVVHWFQIIRNKSFQMYDDDAPNAWKIGASSRYYKVAKFPTRNIKTPIVLLYGGSDSLVDIRVMLKELPKHTIATEVPHFEHLDFLWAQDVDKLVFPHVFEALRCYALDQHTNGMPRELALSMMDTPQLQRRHTNGSNSWSEDEGTYSDYENINGTPAHRWKSYAQLQRERQYVGRPFTPTSPIMTWDDHQRRPALDADAQSEERIAEETPARSSNGLRLKAERQPDAKAAKECTAYENSYPEQIEDQVIREPAKSGLSAPVRTRARYEDDKHSLSDSGRSSPVHAVFGSKGISLGASRPSISTPSHPPQAP